MSIILCLYRLTNLVSILPKYGTVGCTHDAVQLIVIHCSSEEILLRLKSSVGQRELEEDETGEHVVAVNLSPIVRECSISPDVQLTLASEQISLPLSSVLL